MTVGLPRRRPDWGADTESTLNCSENPPLGRSGDCHPGLDTGLGDIEVLLTIAKPPSGSTSTRQNSTALCSRSPTSLPTRLSVRSAAPSAVDPELVRSHVRQLIDRGVSADTIAARSGMDTPWVGRLLSGKLGPWMAASRAEQILAIETPPQSAP
jgi:hypothetical protein